MIKQWHKILRQYAATSMSMAKEIEAIATAEHVNLERQIRLLQALENDCALQTKLIKVLWKLIPKPSKSQLH